MTVLPFLDIKATPIHSVELPQSALLRSITTNKSSKNSSPISSIQTSQQQLPKIKISARTDETLKRLPCSKSDVDADKHSIIWKPFTRDLPDYDYLWEPLRREDIRHQYDFYKTPKRIIASRPDEPIKMTTMFETSDRHYHNYQRVRGMQQRQWNNEHIQYTIYPYADIYERELYNQNIRWTLQEQMREKAETERMEHDIKSLESHFVIQRDQEDLEEEKQKQKHRTHSLRRITTKNKELMENKWKYDQWNRTHQWHVERTILADDPINWSKTMT